MLRSDSVSKFPKPKPEKPEPETPEPDKSDPCAPLVLGSSTTISFNNLCLTFIMKIETYCINILKKYPTNNCRIVTTKI